MARTAKTKLTQPVAGQPVTGHRVVVFLQENKTTDFYFPTLAAWGAAVANHGNLLSVPPNFDQHFALGSNSTSGHMLAVGGQTPTLKNPPFVGAHPTWNIPSIFSLAETAGVSWAAFPDQTGYPTKLSTSLNTPKR